MIATADPMDRHAHGDDEDDSNQGSEGDREDDNEMDEDESEADGAIDSLSADDVVVSMELEPPDSKVGGFDPGCDLYDDANAVGACTRARNY